ncbi:MAG: NosD domain-containing protein, partial [Candidatus Thorarchaeota archaeon]
MKRLVVLSIFVLFTAMLSSPTTPIVSSEDFGVSNNDVSIEYQVAQSYTPHAAMNISSNADFAAHNWNGSGTELDPYSISGWSFDTSYPIWIENTTAFFSIENCYFTSGSVDDGTAIVLSNVTNGNIQSCVFEELYSAIGMSQCNDTRFQSNTIRNVSTGVGISFAYGLEIISNHVENVSRGMIIMFAFDSRVTKNTVHDCGWLGIDVSGWGTGSIVSDNEIYDIHSFWFAYGALNIEGHDWTVVNNSIHDSYRGISSEFWGIESSNITANEITDCVQGMYFTQAKDTVIRDNEIVNATSGISLWDCDGIDIQSNVIDSRFQGIWAESCLHLKLKDNQLSYGGIY